MISLCFLSLCYEARIDMHSNLIKPFTEHSTYHIVIGHGLGVIIKSPLTQNCQAV